MRLGFLAIISFTGLLSTSGCGNDTPRKTELETQVIGLEDAVSSNESWGALTTYSTADTYGTRDSFVGSALIKAGLEIHPPHAHAEEEYLLVVEGEGEWTIGNETFPARAGDMLYAAPWDLHGIKNTGSMPLKFVVWKWNSAGLPVQKNNEQNRIVEIKLYFLTR